MEVDLRLTIATEGADTEAEAVEGAKANLIAALACLYDFDELGMRCSLLDVEELR